MKIWYRDSKAVWDTKYSHVLYDHFNYAALIIYVIRKSQTRQPHTVHYTTSSNIYYSMIPVHIVLQENYK